MTIKNFALTTMLLTLVACGGGGGGVTETPDIDGGNNGGTNGGTDTTTAGLYMWDLKTDKSVRYATTTKADYTPEYAYKYDDVFILEPYGEVVGNIAPAKPANAIYTGTGVVDAFGVSDGAAVYNLTGGNALVVLDDASLEVALDGFTLTEVEGAVVSPIGSINITSVDMGASKCGNAAFFCGGEFSVKRSNNDAVLLSSSATQDLNGAFFGADGSEAGGIVSIHQDKTLSLNASFIADSK